ncbi:MAG: FprA family A-type flavoprotein [Proteobacteria bacterium]|nr:FprA family A-type flavoprotein [Pseudomonadota bacterium]
MHSAVPVTDSITWIGANDRETDLFEGLWPLPRGVSYNSYLVKAAKTAVIDTVKRNSFDRYLDNIRRCVGCDGIVDYLVVNHMEPDHSGSIRLLLNIFPEMKIVGNAKTAAFLEQFYGIRDNVVTVAEGGELDLGGRVLGFHMTPMVHWPETMMTYDAAEGVLFSGDAFGGFGALEGGIFDDEVDIDYFEGEILRYFSNIVGKYCIPVQAALKKLAGLGVKTICATHGPIWRKDPSWIIERYDRWSRHEGEEGVVVVYGSMYGNTERMMEACAVGLADEEVSRVRIHDVSRMHVSYLIRDAWRFRGLILGSPTYDTGLYPPMDHFIRLLAHKRLMNRVLGLFGTFGWSGGGVSTLTEFAKGGRGAWDLVEPIVEARCAPSAEDLKRCEELGRNVVKRLRGELEARS